MVSFKEFRDLLILLYADNIISDAEFVLLYETFTSKNPDFPYDSYERFNLDSMNAAECKAEFRVEKQDVPRLVQALLVLRAEKYLRRYGRFMHAAQTCCVPLPTQ